MAASVLLLAAFAVILAADVFEHTDDGCAVEIHCLPCQWHHGATVIIAALPKPAAPIDRGRAVVLPPHSKLVDVSESETPSRAPPLV